MFLQKHLDQTAFAAQHESTAAATLAKGKEQVREEAITMNDCDDQLAVIDDGLLLTLPSEYHYSLYEEDLFAVPSLHSDAADLSAGYHEFDAQQRSKSRSM